MAKYRAQPLIVDALKIVRIEERNETVLVITEDEVTHEVVKNTPGRIDDYWITDPVSGENFIEKKENFQRKFYLLPEDETMKEMKA